MKLSKKYKQRIKKRLLGCMSSIAICLVLIAGCDLAGLSTPISKIRNFSTTKSNADESTLGKSTRRYRFNRTKHKE